MRALDDYLLVENEDEVAYGDEIRNHKMFDLPDCYPTIYRKGTLHGYSAWRKTDKNDVLNAVKCLNEKIEKLNKFLEFASEDSTCRQE